jgi:hypothetical protein
MKSIIRSVTAVVAVMFAVATLCPAQGRQADRPGQEGGVQWQEDRDEGQDEKVHVGILRAVRAIRRTLVRFDLRTPRAGQVGRYGFQRSLPFVGR